MLCCMFAAFVDVAVVAGIVVAAVAVVALVVLAVIREDPCEAPSV